MSRRRVTSFEVARLAGVSQSAVSRSFTEGASVAPETRQRVLEAAQALGYRPNALARGLITNRTGLVGVVMGDLDGPFQPYLFERLTRGLGRLGMQPLLIRGDPTADVGGPSLAALDYQVDAVVVTASSVSATTIDEVTASGVPVVLYGRASAGTLVDGVACDNEAGVRLVADALIAAGHRRIGYLAGRPGAPSEQERGIAFIRALGAHGARLTVRAEGDYSYDSGRRAAHDLAAARLDALFCGNDAMALGVLDAARHELGLKVPDDLSVIGFDDVPMAAWPSFDLTTVRNPVDDLVVVLLDLLTRRLDRPDAPGEFRRLAPTLVRRGSARL